jgi:hypothetical protein
VLFLSHMLNRFKLVFKCVMMLIYSVSCSADPCAKKHCGAGRVCELTEEGEAECVCISLCPEEVDPRRKVHDISEKSNQYVYLFICFLLFTFNLLAQDCTGVVCTVTMNSLCVDSIIPADTK